MIAGIDEVGRGSWAGPLVAAAVVLPENFTSEDIKDSKKMSPSKRISVARLVYQNAVSVGLGWASPKYIDTHGITDATSAAMHHAVSQLNVTPERIHIDGNYNYLPDKDNIELFVRGDDTKQHIGAASIIAKVARDAFMQKIDSLYPGYSFKTNVGYGSAEHRRALTQFGVTPLHRMSWKPMNTMSA